MDNNNNNNIKTFKVIPDVPKKLSALYDIAYNLWIYWNPDAIKLFIRMDDGLWDATRHNAVKMLGEIGQERLDELANDEGYVLEVSKVHRRLTQYLTHSTTNSSKDSPCIGYFSLEYGINEAMPIYSGGLGVLAGDHIKSSSDLGLNLKGIGLLYQLGYFRQYLNRDGWQQDFYDTNDFYNMPLKEETRDGHPVEINVELPGRILYLKVWKLSVGRVSIFLMDSNIEKNSENDRKLTAQLYGGGREFRLEQEIILGIGGIRLLDRLGIDVDVIHMNEGHSSFAIFERTKLFMQKHGLSFDQAMEVTRKTAVFTTHTPVPAGNDEFHPELIRRYFQDYCSGLGITIENFLAFGRERPGHHNENFSMPVLAIRHASYINGVSKLHGQVAQTMWKGLWHDVPEEHIPIRSVTNGVHLASWLSFEMSQLFSSYLGDNWQEKQDSIDLWKKTKNIPDPEIWRTHCARRRRLIYFIRSRLKKQLTEKGASPLLISQSQEALNPDVLTIGFARRFATYKRGDLVFRDLEKLKELVNDPSRPVQFIFAGKAHPQDHAGKEIIKHIIHSIDANDLLKKIVFIEDYDMNVARYMVQGVDVWLNNPLRPHEASGTSGMKAVANGGLNLSVLDGWWDEAYDRTNGWAIGSGESGDDYNDRNYQDEVESKAIYSIIENDIIPMFYDCGSDRLPREWIKMMKNAFVSLASFFNTHRMLKEYTDKFYNEAGRNFNTLSADDFKQTRELVEWKNRIRDQFGSIKIRGIRLDEKNTYKINDRIKVEVEVSTGNLEPKDIKVDIYYGSISGDHTLVDTAIENLSEVTPVADDKHCFSGHLTCQKAGNFGCRIRITPYHSLIIDPYEMDLVLWK
ncbi:MAG: glycosyltransferase family 1 protein [bacterium]|nr:glycosyltransferase family 1 protein [bacterium]